MTPAEALQAHMAQLFEEGRFTDTTILCGGSTFRCHRVRAAARRSATTPSRLTSLAAPPLASLRAPRSRAQAVLAMSGYFSAIMSDAWSEGGIGGSAGGGRLKKS